MSFPFEPMQKQLKRETLAEVDDSPSIYNARDFNIHERELAAIQRVLVGKGMGTGTGLLGAYLQVLTALRSIQNGGLIGQYAGVIHSGESVPVPSSAKSAKTSGALLTTDTTINVDSTSGFPEKGTLTKFNAVSATTSGGTKSYSFGKSIMNYEIISYTGLTPTSFTGCTRAVDGLAQDVASSASALILSGRASLVLSHQAWNESIGTTPIQFYIEHDAALNVVSNMFDNKATLTVADKGTIRITYSLLLSGHFDDVRVGGI